MAGLTSRGSTAGAPKQFLPWGCSVVLAKVVQGLSACCTAYVHVRSRRVWLQVGRRRRRQRLVVLTTMRREPLRPIAMASPHPLDLPRC